MFFHAVVFDFLIINIINYLISPNDQNLDVTVLQKHSLEAYVVTVLICALFSKMAFSLPKIGEGRWGNTNDVVQRRKWLL